MPLTVSQPSDTGGCATLISDTGSGRLLSTRKWRSGGYRRTFVSATHDDEGVNGWTCGLCGVNGAQATYTPQLPIRCTMSSWRDRSRPSGVIWFYKLDTDRDIKGRSPRLAGVRLPGLLRHPAQPHDSRHQAREA